MPKALLLRPGQLQNLHRLIPPTRDSPSKCSAPRSDGCFAKANQCPPAIFVYNSWKRPAARSTRNTPVLNQNNVTAPLTHHTPAFCLKNAHYLHPRHQSRLCHQAITSTLAVSIVSGIPNSALTSRQDVMASGIISMASSRVFPHVTHPGMEGHSAIHAPSSSRSIVTVKFIVLY